MDAVDLAEAASASAFTPAGANVDLAQSQADFRRHTLKPLRGVSFLRGYKKRRNNPTGRKWGQGINFVPICDKLMFLKTSF